MKCYTQVYVMNSIEAAKTYCKAFGAEITLEMKNSSGTAYEHCVLSVDGEGILALAEAKIFMMWNLFSGQINLTN